MIDARDDESRARLAAALGVRRWVDEVAAGGPYASTAALVEAGHRAASTLSDAELDEAAAAPPAGERASGDGTAVRIAAHREAGLGAAEDGAEAAVARGDEVYRQRFGRDFLIRTEGRTGQEVLDELQRRLKNTPEEEAAETAEQLREIAALRLEALFGE